MNYWTQSKDNIFVAAHRGWCAVYPENTMLAFKKAIEIGVDQIETDIRITADGELVCIHDAAVDRTTDGTGLVIDKTFAELRALDAGIKKGEEFRGERVPTFIELMELVKDHPTLTLDIELKEAPTPEDPNHGYEICDRVLKIVDDYGFTDRIVINSFSAPLHEYIKDKYGEKYRRHIYYPISYFRNASRDPYHDGAYCCCMFTTLYSTLNMSTPEEFKRMESFGIQPWAGAGIKTLADVDKAIEAGAVLITCNNPDEILEFLRQRGRHK